MKKYKKVEEKLHVFWEYDFRRILGGFWEGFGKPRTSIFALFSMIFRSKIWKTFWKAKKSKKRASGRGPSSILGRPGGMCVARGRDREGVSGDLGLDFEA